MTLYIHIGTHKTGTSTIQKYLDNNKNSLLLDNQINYIPNINLIKQKYDQNLTNIISSELLIGNLETLYSDTEAACSQLKTKLSNHIDINNIKIILFLREQSDFIQSSYVQFIQQGKQLNLNNLLQYSDNLFYTKIVDIWKQSFELKIIPYDIEILKKTNIIELFFNEISLSKICFNHIENHNISMSNNAIVIMKKIIELKSQNKVNINLVLLRRFLQEVSHKSMYSNFSILNDDIIQQLQNKYYYDNTALFKKHINKKFIIKNFTYRNKINNFEPCINDICLLLKAKFPTLTNIEKML